MTSSSLNAREKKNIFPFKILILQPVESAVMAVAPLPPPPPSYAFGNDCHFKHAQGRTLGVCEGCPTQGAKVAISSVVISTFEE
jgi:hypothetical protein